LEQSQNTNELQPQLASDSEVKGQFWRIQFLKPQTTT